MKYSCGLWDAEHNTLALAQDAHLAAVVESLRLTPDFACAGCGRRLGPLQWLRREAQRLPRRWSRSLSWYAGDRSAAT